MAGMKITPKNTLLNQKLFATIPPDVCKHPALIGGFGSGKTYSVPLRWLYLIDWRGRKQRIRNRTMITEPTYEMIRDILVPTLDEWFSMHGIWHHYHQTAHNYDIRYRGVTFTAMLRSTDKPASLTGKNLTDIILDEFDKEANIKKQKDIWKECISRVRVAPHGTVAAVTTPEGFRYTYTLWGDCDYKEKKNFKLFRARTPDNHFLPPDYVENLYEQYDAQLVQQYIEAQFINIMQGRVYYNFNRKVHVKKLEFRKNKPLYLSFDFNFSPMTTSFSHIVPGGTGEQSEVVHVVRSLNTRDSNTDKQCKIIKEILNEEDFGGDLIITGDATDPHSTTSNVTNWEIIRYHFPHAQYLVKSVNPAVTDRVNSHNSKLLNSVGKVGMYISSENCAEMIRDHEQVSWKEDKRYEIDKSNGELTHNTDNLGYLIWEKFPLIRPTSFKQGRYH